MAEETKEPVKDADLKPKYEKWLALSQRMDKKNDEKYKEKTQGQKKKRLDCSGKCLNENVLLTYSKEELVSFILTNRDKLLLDEKKHRKNQIKKQKKQMDFDKQP